MKKDLIIPEKITDDFIINFFVIQKNNKNLFKKGISKQWFNNHQNILNYLKNRYSEEFHNYIETIYRIFYGINIIPSCQYCGRPTTFLDFQHGYQTYCCSKCANSDPDKINKQEQTCLIKYGVKNPHQNKQIIKKAEQTCIEKYGVAYYTQLDECKEKIKQTNLIKYGKESHNSVESIKEKRKETLLSKYGVENPSQIEEVKQKKEQTMLKHYGVKYSLQSAEIRKKYEETNLERNGSKTYRNDKKIEETLLSKYGVKNISQLDSIKKQKEQTYKSNYGSKEKQLELKNRIKQTSINRYGCAHYNQSEYGRKQLSIIISSPEVQNKINESKKKNHTFNSSKVEQQFLSYLTDYYPNDFEAQYRSELYPFNCDFYIRSLDLYIEIQGSWTHGYHPYDPNDISDMAKVNSLLEKAGQQTNTSKKSYYFGAYETWTIKDPLKRKTAVENNLNYLEVFSCKVEDVIQALNDYIEGCT